MATEHAAVIRRLYQDVWNGENPVSADDLVHEDFYIHDRDMAEELTGPELYKQLASGTRDAFPDVHFTIEDIFAADDRVAVRWKMTGTHEGEVFGVEPTGQEVEMNAIEINRFEDGQLIETWSQSDEISLMQQLGAL